jgi:hypothetical protein
MDQGLMVDELIRLGGSNLSIQKQYSPVGFRFHQLHILKPGSKRGDLPFEFRKKPAVFRQVVEDQSHFSLLDGKLVEA